MSNSRNRIDSDRSRKPSLVAATALATLMSSLLWGAPRISGVKGKVAHTGTITITGSGFGTHRNYNNIDDSWSGDRYLNFRFNDFEDGRLKAHGFYPQRGGAPWSPSSTALSVRSGGPTNSMKYLRRAYDGGENGGLSTDSQGSGNKLYTTFKFMVEPNTQSGKFWRFYADPPQQNVWLATGCSSYQVRGFSECTAQSCSGATTEWGSGPTMTPGQWHRVEIYADATTNTFTVWVNGVQAWSKRNWLNTSLQMDGHTIDFPNMIDSNARDASCPATGSFNYDDIFVDFTPARVEIGDARTWDDVRHKEVQIPVSWSDGSIEVRVNAGEFREGTSAYLYVIDANGQVNENGYPVTIGAAVVRPKPPMDVRVE